VEALAALDLMAVTAGGQGDDDEHQPDQRRGRRADHQIIIFPTGEHPLAAIADHGLRRTDQTKADRLLISAARAISMAGSNTSMDNDSVSLCSLFVPYSQ